MLLEQLRQEMLQLHQWVINKFIAYYGATYIRGLTVISKT